MPPQDEEIAEAAIAQLGLTPLRGRLLDSLSGGQRQKAYLAMCLAQDTRYLLLAEPLNNLDLATARGLMQSLTHLKIQNKTILVVLHDINYALQYADHLIALKNGRVASSGPPDQVVNAAFLRQVFETDAPIHVVNNRPFVLC